MEFSSESYSYEGFLIFKNAATGIWTVVGHPEFGESVNKQDLEDAIDEYKRDQGELGQDNPGAPVPTERPPGLRR